MDPNNVYESEIDEDEEWFKILRDWDRKRRVAAVLLQFCALYIVTLMHLGTLPEVDEIPPETIEQRERNRKLLMRGLEYQRYCKSVLRMTPVAFRNLCEKLKGGGLLKPTRYASIEEQVTKFLMIVAHQTKNRYCSFLFRRSGETTSRHFHNVLRAIIALEDEFLKQPNGAEVSPEIQTDTRYFPYFKDCVGAIDGTHIRANVPIKDATRYRGRKDYPTQNVLAACNFDLTFTYVLPGWEGTASDSRIIKNALTRDDNLKMPQRKYYLVDAGFMLRAGLLAPYRGVRYHSKEYSSCGPVNREELFNLRHASLRNAIERAFGVLKKRFPIIGSANEKIYPFDTQCDIVLACFILHNYLMKFNRDDELISEVDREIECQLNSEEEGTESYPRSREEEDARLGIKLRDSIASEMWQDYTSRL